ncbi:MAG: alpha-2-macroglobulin family protein, partial [Bacteroidales bacterium]
NKSAQVESTLPLWQTPIAQPAKEGTVTLKNSNEGIIFAQLTQRYLPLFDKAAAINQGLSLKVSYVLPNGTPANIENMKQGTNFTMIAEVKNTSSVTDYNNLALTQIFASGWENLSTRYAGISETKSGFDYQDIRDDRVATFFQLKKGETKRFMIRLQAAYAGQFYLPAVHCEAMYDASVIARSQAKQISIIRE